MPSNSILNIKKDGEWVEIPALKGEDGFSPTATVEKVGKVATITITDINGTTTATIADGTGSGGSGEENTIESISVNGTPISIDSNKNVDITVPSIEGLTKDADLATVAKSGSYNDLADKPTIPSKISQLENDSNYLSSIPEEYVTETELEAKGYLTEHQDISGKVDKVEGKSLISDTEIARLATVNNYDDTEVKAEIAKKANATAIPSKVSELTNDSNYQTAEQVSSTVTTEIAKVVADAPEDLNTLKEMSDWISGHENDASAMNSAIQTNKSDIATLQTDKVDKETGKSLLADTDKANYDDAVSKAHTHDNKSVLDGITSDKISSWDNKSDFSGSYNDLSDKPTIPKADGITITMDEDGTLRGQSKVDEMTGATAEKDGTSGTVPAPTAGQESLFLRGDGTWAEAKQDLSAYYNNANYDTENNKLQLMNGDTVLKEIEISGGGGTKIVTFADGTDEEIVAMIEAHYNDKINIADYWAVGDTRTVHLSAMSATGVDESHREQDVQFVIGDFEHDDLETPINGHTKAAITLLQKDCLMDATSASNVNNGSSDTEKGYMNSSNTNSGGWKSCARRTWCNNVYYNALPSALKSIVKTVNKKSGTGGGSSSGTETTQDKIFLAAEIEIFGSTTYSFAGEGTQYQYYKNATANRYKMPKWSSSYVSHAYWERSPRSGNTTVFCIMYNSGDARDSTASGSFGVAPCLCI